MVPAPIVRDDVPFCPICDTQMGDPAETLDIFYYWECYPCLYSFTILQKEWDKVFPTER